VQAILHSLAHIESWAVDLAWDIIARFGQNASYELPRAFFDDFVAVAEDEGRHFKLLARRLEVRCGIAPACAILVLRAHRLEVPCGTAPDAFIWTLLAQWLELRCGADSAPAGQAAQLR
jgi:Protein of unknown function (DUF455)